jgi:hypothetical protein
MEGDARDAGAGTSEQTTTSSLNRNISHLDLSRWMTAVALAAVVRTTAQHPFNVALARKRLNRETVGVVDVLREGYRVGAAGADGTMARGVRALYRGWGVCVAGNVVGECLYLSILEHVRHHMPVGSEVVRDASGGALGDLCSLAVCTPLAVVCNRQMTAGFGMAASNAYEPAVRVVARLRKSESGLIRGLYAGLGASLYVVPASAIWWGTYGVVKRGLYTAAAPFLDSSASSMWSPTSSTDNPVLNALAGVAAALVTTTATNPFMVVRTRLQALDDQSPRVRQEGLLRRSRTVRVARDLVQHEGYRGLLKGLRVNAAVAAIDGLLFSSVYEITKWISDRTL